MSKQPVAYQDPTWRSWRVWGSVFSGATGVLLVPEVQSWITALVCQMVPVDYLPLVTAALGALWPLISKWRDHRPVRPPAQETPKE